MTYPLSRPRPRVLPPVCILSSPEWEWVGRHFTLADWRAGVSNGTFPLNTVARIDGAEWVVVERLEPTRMGPRYSKRAKPLRPVRVAVRV